MDEIVPLFSFGRCCLKIDEETDIVVRFWLRLDKLPILSSDDVQSTVSNELVPTTDVHRKKKSRFTLECGEVKPDSIKVYELHIK